MKIKLLLILGILFVGLGNLSASALDCGLNISVEMVKVDAQGYAPRLKEGAQAQFDCVTVYDPNFANARLPDVIAATNYWYSLVGQAWGVTLTPLATPTG